MFIAGVFALMYVLCNQRFTYLITAETDQLGN